MFQNIQSLIFREGQFLRTLCFERIEANDNLKNMSKIIYACLFVVSNQSWEQYFYSKDKYSHGETRQTEKKITKLFAWFVTFEKKIREKFGNNR